MYGPEAYGVQGVFVSLATVLSTIVTLSYPIAIVLPKADSDAWGIARLSILISAASCFILWVLLNYFGNDMLNLLNAQTIAHLIPLIPIFLFVSASGKIISQWAIRKKHFHLIASVSVKQSVITNSMKFAIGMAYPTGTSLIIANTLGFVATGFLTFLGLRKSMPLNAGDRNINRKQRGIFFTFYKYRDFPILRTPQELLNVVSQALPLIMLSTYFGPVSVGYYSLGLSVLAMPAGLIGSSVMQVFYPRINEAIHNGENAQALIIKATKILAVTGGLPFLVVIIAGPFLFKHIFGAEWESAGVYAQWLAAWIFFQFINKPAVSAIPALRLQGNLLVYEIFSTGSKILALYIGYFKFNSDQMAIALFSIFGVVAYAWLIIWVIIRSANYQNNPTDK